jgi:hypothetical protein
MCTLGSAATKDPADARVRFSSLSSRESDFITKFQCVHYYYHKDMASARTSRRTRVSRPVRLRPTPRVHSIPVSAPGGLSPNPLLSLSPHGRHSGAEMSGWGRARPQRALTHSTLVCRPLAPSSARPPTRPRPNSVKHLQHECNIRLKTIETFRTCTYNICVKHIKHPNKTLTTCNIKPLAATWDWNSWNIRNILLQHMCETYATSR